MKHEITHDLDIPTAKKVTDKAFAEYSARYPQYQPTFQWANDRRADIGDRIGDVGQRPDVGRLQVGFVRQGHLRRLGQDEMALNRQVAQNLQHPHAVANAAGARDADDQPLIMSHFPPPIYPREGTPRGPSLVCNETGPGLPSSGTLRLIGGPDDSR